MYRLRHLHSESVLFDLDGVLVDFMIVVERTWYRWLADVRFSQTETGITIA